MKAFCDKHYQAYDVSLGCDYCPKIFSINNDLILNITSCSLKDNSFRYQRLGYPADFIDDYMNINIAATRLPLAKDNLGKKLKITKSPDIVKIIMYSQPTETMEYVKSHYESIVSLFKYNEYITVASQDPLVPNKYYWKLISYQ